jgi:GTPase involved in cell partitioning and DNA repair
MNELQTIKIFIEYDKRMIKILKAELKEYNTQLLNVKRKIKLTKRDLYNFRESYNKKLEYIQKTKGAKNE